MHESINQEIHYFAHSDTVNRFEYLLLLARKLLDEDIANPKINVPLAINIDQFMLRANEIGVSLLGAGAYHHAELIYRDLLERTLLYRKSYQVKRHAGALYANIATCCWKQGNVEQFVINCLKAADEDRLTADVERKKSFAMTGIYESHLAIPAFDEVEHLIRNFASTVDTDFRTALGDLELAFLGTVYTTRQHILENNKFPNVYSRLQLFGAMRTLSALFESHIKRLKQINDGNLYETLVNVYGTEPDKRTWWPAYDKTVQKLNKSIKTQLISREEAIYQALALNSNHSLGDDPPPGTSPDGVRVLTFPQKQPVACSPSCYADDDDYTLAATAR